MPPPAAPVGPGELRIVPANLAVGDDLAAVFGTRGTGSRCQCQRYRLQPGESFARVGPDELARRLRTQTRCGEPDAERTSGLVAYLGGVAVGWCAVAPRPSFDHLVRSGQVPWKGRDTDPDDPTVWAVTCVFVRAGYRRRGIGAALIASAVDHAGAGGAAAVEGYPITTTNVIDEELHVGTVGMFADAGLTEVSRPTSRRVVMRRDFPVAAGPA